MLEKIEPLHIMLGVILFCVLFKYRKEVVEKFNININRLSKVINPLDIENKIDVCRSVKLTLGGAVRNNVLTIKEADMLWNNGISKYLDCENRLQEVSKIDLMFD